jgi:hypothetical protein
MKKGAELTIGIAQRAARVLPEHLQSNLLSREDNNAWNVPDGPVRNALRRNQRADVDSLRQPSRLGGA